MTKPNQRIKITLRPACWPALIESCMKAARKAGRSQDQIDMFKVKMTSGDYVNLLATIDAYFDVEWLPTERKPALYW